MIIDDVVVTFGQAVANRWSQSAQPQLGAGDYRESELGIIKYAKHPNEITELARTKKCKKVWKNDDNDNNHK